MSPDQGSTSISAIGDQRRHAFRRLSIKSIWRQEGRQSGNLPPHIMFASSFLGFAAAYAAATLAAPPPSRAAVSPTVQLDNGTFTGTSDGATNSFLGIKFAEAPYVEVSKPCGPWARLR